MNKIKKCMADLGQFLDRTAGVISDEGIIVGSTNAEMLDVEDTNVSTIFSSDEPIIKTGNKSYKIIEINGYGSLVVYVEGTDNVAVTYLELITCCLEANLRESNDFQVKETFLKNVLLENELPGDISLKSREFDVSYSTPRLVLVLKNQTGDSLRLVSSLHRIFADSNSDYVLPLDENTVVILLDASESSDISTYEEAAKKILTQLLTDDLISARIGIGLIADTLKDTAKSYREASLALTVGNIFEPSSYLMRYDRLGLGRLIYQLPPTLCQMFLQEVFKPGAYDALDRETLTTIYKFFENNLNGSETSRQLFVHRNTLVYRLDKVQKITGLDLRNFDDAVLFKLASMVRRYLERRDSLKLNEPDHWW